MNSEQVDQIIEQLIGIKDNLARLCDCMEDSPSSDLQIDVMFAIKRIANALDIANES